MENYNVACYLQTGLNMSESTGGLKGKQSHESKLMKDAYLGKKQSKSARCLWQFLDEEKMSLISMTKEKTLQK